MSGYILSDILEKVWIKNLPSEEAVMQNSKNNIPKIPILIILGFSDAFRNHGYKDFSHQPGLGGGMGAKTGLYQVGTLSRKQDSYVLTRAYIVIKELQKHCEDNNDNKTGLYQLKNLVRRLTPIERSKVFQTIGLH